MSRSSEFLGQMDMKLFAREFVLEFGLNLLLYLSLLGFRVKVGGDFTSALVCGFRMRDENSDA